MKTRLSIIGLIFVVYTGGVLAAPQQQDIAERIQKTYESQLFTLVPYVQRHYALRMYRLSGDEKYLYPVITDMMVIAALLNQDIKGLHDPEHINKREQIVLNRFNLAKEKHKRRFELLKQYSPLAFSLALLANVNMIHEVGLSNTAFFPDTDRVIKFLKQQDFATFFLNPDVVEIYSPQLATYIFFLNDLGITDLRDKFTREFKKVFMGTDDKGLSEMLYAQKLYGLTHFIIGASRNYQYPVKRKDYEWIYSYFENNIDTILQRAKPDIIAEVGIAFLLAGETDNPVIAKARQAVTASFNEQSSMIPSVSGDTDLNLGEHRNVLAIMLLTWPDRLFPGPDLNNTRQYQQFWLRDYLP